MKALITAAGLGTRMGALAKNTNKCLLLVGNKSLIKCSVDNFKMQGIDDIHIITGHYAHLIKQELSGKANLIYNKDYASTSILGSIILARAQLQDSEFIFMTGDSLIHYSLIEKMIANKNKGDILVSIDAKKCDEEDMKVIVEQGVIINISKNIPVHLANGEYTSLTYFSSKASRRFFDLIHKYLKKDEKKYVAEILLELQKEGLRLIPVYTEQLPRIELDYPDDFLNANKMVQEFPDLIYNPKVSKD